MQPSNSVWELFMIPSILWPTLRMETDTAGEGGCLPQKEYYLNASSSENNHEEHQLEDKKGLGRV